MAYTTDAVPDKVSADVGNSIVHPEKILHEYVTTRNYLNIRANAIILAYLASDSLVTDRKMCLTPRYL